jgi:hypothetical protein
MDKLKCVDMQQWIQQIVLSDELPLPKPALVAHIVSCELCRGAFALLAAAALDLPSLAAPFSCRQSEENLAAFIEQEVEEGSTAAIRTYPQVWWHLWICEDCAETYRVTRRHLLTAQSQAIATLLQTAKPARTRLAQLSRPFLHQALAKSPPARAATRGQAGQSYILTEQASLDGDLLVSVQRQSNGEWQLGVVHQPPPTGSLVLIFGEQYFHASFNAQGRAVVHDLPFALLTAADGPDLEVDIEADTEDSLEQVRSQ